MLRPHYIWFFLCPFSIQLDFAECAEYPIFGKFRAFIQNQNLFHTV